MAKILIVDDEKSLRVTLGAILRGGGYAVELAEDARVALDRLNGESFDVVLSDIVLPRMTGVELMKQIRATWPRVQVILMTGEPSVETAAEAVRTGAFDYLSKSVTKEAVLRVVGSAARLKEMDDERERLAVANRQHQERLEELVKERTRELSQALETLQRAQAQMVQEERLSALGQMASGIAHDFNNVLVPILGYSDMLLSRPDLLTDRDRALSMIREISTAARDARQIVRRMRLIRGVEDTGEWAPLDVNALVLGALDMTRTRWDTELGARGIRIDVVKRLAAEAPVLGDESQVREALMNLILNAVDAMPNGGTLTLSSAVENEQMVLGVADTGEGMTAETRARCLEPFFTTKGAKGTGLGLAMVNGIVTRHKGTLTIDSSPGAGTTIRIRLPRASTSPVGGTSGEPTSEADDATAPLRVLVADDEAAARELLKQVLMLDGHSVVLARTGREAIEKAGAEAFDLVITDRAMPEGNGDQVALSVKARSPGTPVILLTGFGEIMKDAGECPAGVDRILSKPVTRLDLRRAIRETVGEGK